MDRLYITKALGTDRFEAITLPSDLAQEKSNLGAMVAKARSEMLLEHRECLACPSECGDEEMAKHYARHIQPLVVRYEGISGPITVVRGSYAVGRVYDLR